MNRIRRGPWSCPNEAQGLTIGRMSTHAIEKEEEEEEVEEEERCLLDLEVRRESTSETSAASLHPLHPGYRSLAHRLVPFFDSKCPLHFPLPIIDLVALVDGGIPG